jgi:hypothetical protein
MRATMLAQRQQQQWHNTSNDASTCCDCFVTGQMPVRDAGGNAKASRTTMSAQQGKSTRLARAMMPALRWQQQQQHNAGNDASAMQAKR